MAYDKTIVYKLLHIISDPNDINSDLSSNIAQDKTIAHNRQLHIIIKKKVLYL